MGEWHKKVVSEARTERRAEDGQRRLLSEPVERVIEALHGNFRGTAQQSFDVGIAYA